EVDPDRPGSRDRRPLPAGADPSIVEVVAELRVAAGGAPVDADDRRVARPVAARPCVAGIAAARATVTTVTTVTAAATAAIAGRRIRRARPPLALRDRNRLDPRERLAPRRGADREEHERRRTPTREHRPSLRCYGHPVVSM